MSEKTSRRRSLLGEVVAEETGRAQAQTELEENTRPRRGWSSYRSGAPRYPLLQTTVDELIRDEEREVRDYASPLSRDGPPDTSDQPVESAEIRRNASTPVPFPALFESASLPKRIGSVRRSRRNTNRSPSSSWSPASAFLSQWSRAEAVSEPDDEGQEIGTHTKYLIGRQIGYGGFSTIKEASTIENEQKIIRAVKIVRKQVEGRSHLENAMLQASFEHETSIWRSLKHPYILSLIDFYDDAFATFCITQLNIGGTLFDLVRSLRRGQAATTSSTDPPSSRPSTPAPRNRRTLPMHLAKRYIYQLASALRYLHQDKRLVHRDIKLENCLVDISSHPDVPSTTTTSSPSIGGTLLLCDFGMADYMRRAAAPDNSDRDDDDDTIILGQELSSPPHNIGPSALSTNIAGSLQYASPELILATRPLYEPCVDIWAFGVVCYALLTRELPFSHELLPKVQAMILKGQWDQALLVQAVGDVDTEPALTLVRGCLEMDPKRRWDVARVLGCEFLSGCRELYGVEM